MNQKPLLLLDNEALLGLLHKGYYRVQEISFEEAKAIVEMHELRQVQRCFSSEEIAAMLYKHLGISVRNFAYAQADELQPEQDAIAFRLYTTPSETLPGIRTAHGNEATKIQNVYVYCQHITKLSPELLALGEKR